MAVGMAKTDARRVQAAERRRTALSLRKAGATYEQIADQLGVSRQTANKLVIRELDKIARENAASAAGYRDLELERLDVMTLKTWSVMNSEAATADQILKAVSSLVKITETRAKLLGLAELPPITPPKPGDTTRVLVAPIAKAATTEELMELRDKLLAMKARQLAATAAAPTTTPNAPSLPLATPSVVEATPTTDTPRTPTSAPSTSAAPTPPAPPAEEPASTFELEWDFEPNEQP